MKFEFVHFSKNFDLRNFVENFQNLVILVA